jgi:hypothetical protein
MLRIVTATLDHFTLRRAVAVICALAFLFVGFAHTAQHADAASPSIASQVNDDNSGVSADAPGTIDVGIDHCHGCVMVAVPAAGEATLPSRITTIYPAATWDGLHPHAPIAETPPPIRTI